MGTPALSTSWRSRCPARCSNGVSRSSTRPGGRVPPGRRGGGARFPPLRRRNGARQRCVSRVASTGADLPHPCATGLPDGAGRALQGGPLPGVASDRRARPGASRGRRDSATRCSRSRRRSRRAMAANDTTNSTPRAASRTCSGIRRPGDRQGARPEQAASTGRPRASRRVLAIGRAMRDSGTGGPAGGSQPLQDLRQAEQAFVALREANAKWQAVLSDGITDVRSEVTTASAERSESTSRAPTA